MMIRDSKTQLRLDVITKVSAGKIPINNAAELLDCSRRTLEGSLNRDQKLGIKCAIHGHRGKRPANKASEHLTLNVQSLIKEKYDDLNVHPLAELLALNEGMNIKRETLRTWAHELHPVKRAKRRRSQVRQKRQRRIAAGLFMHMDGSTPQGFGDKTCGLIAMTDDATCELQDEFFKSELTPGCLRVMQHSIKKKGIFQALFVDRAGIFAGPKRCHFSQMQRACDELPIQHQERDVLSVHWIPLKIA